MQTKLGGIATKLTIFTCRTVLVVDPSRTGLFHGRSDDGRSDNGNGNLSVFLLQQVLSEGLRVRIRIRTMTDQPDNNMQLMNELN